MAAILIRTGAQGTRPKLKGWHCGFSTNRLTWIAITFMGLTSLRPSGMEGRRPNCAKIARRRRQEQGAAAYWINLVLA